MIYLFSNGSLVMGIQKKLKMLWKSKLMKRLGSHKMDVFFLLKFLVEHTSTEMRYELGYTVAFVNGNGVLVRADKSVLYKC